MGNSFLSNFILGNCLLLFKMAFSCLGGNLDFPEFLQKNYNTVSRSASDSSNFFAHPNSFCGSYLRHVKRKRQQLCQRKRCLKDVTKRLKSFWLQDCTYIRSLTLT